MHAKLEQKFCFSYRFVLLSRISSEGFISLIQDVNISTGKELVVTLCFAQVQLIEFLYLLKLLIVNLLIVKIK